MSSDEHEQWRAFFRARGAMGLRTGHYTEAAKGSFDLIPPGVEARRGRAIADVLARTRGVVLDAGCGTGDHLIDLAALHPTVIGLDFAHEMLLSARVRTSADRVVGCQLVEGSVTDLPLRPRSVDALFCRGVLGAVSADAVDRVIREFARVLRPGGVAVINVKNALSPYGMSVGLARAVRWAIGLRRPPIRWSYRTPSWYRRRLAEYFDVVGEFSHDLHPALCPDKLVSAISRLELLLRPALIRWGAELYFALVRREPAACSAIAAVTPDDTESSIRQPVGGITSAEAAIPGIPDPPGPTSRRAKLREPVGSHYDRVIVGSSPISLMEAIHLAHEGRSVLIAERSEWPGGAWATFDWEGWSDVERGCHVIYRSRSVYELLRKYGCDLRCMTPQPIYVLGRLRVPHAVPVPEMVRCLKWPGLDAVVELARATGSNGLQSLRGHRFMYPRGGCGELMRQLMAVAHRAGVHLSLGAEVASIDVRGPSEPLQVSLSGRPLDADSVSITPGTLIADLRVGGARLRVTEKQYDFVQVHLLLHAAAPVTVSYAYTVAHPLLLRVSDLTGYCRGPRTSSLTVLCAQIRRPRPSPQREPDVAAEVLDALKRLGFVSSAASLAHHRWDVYRVAAFWRDELNDIEQTLGPRVKVLRTGNLALNMEMYLERWMATAHIPRVGEGWWAKTSSGQAVLSNGTDR
jgi:SAM-dependent methyltransferase